MQRIGRDGVLRNVINITFNFSGGCNQLWLQRFPITIRYSSSVFIVLMFCSSFYNDSTNMLKLGIYHCSSSQVNLPIPIINLKTYLHNFTLITPLSHTLAAQCVINMYFYLITALIWFGHTMSSGALLGVCGKILCSASESHETEESGLGSEEQLLTEMRPLINLSWPGWN